MASPYPEKSGPGFPDYLCIFIFHEPKMQEPIFFLHFPRTAGTTIDNIFYSNFAPENIISIYSAEEFQKYRAIEPEKLEKIQFITGHLILENLNPPTFYGQKVRAFTLLREPIQRLVSEFNFLRTWDKQHLYEYLHSREISFQDYITSNDKLLMYRGKNFMTRCISGDSLENLADIRSSLEKAKYNLLNNFWFYGIQEKFPESMLILAQKANLKNILHQQHNALNKSSANNYSPSEKDIEIVKEYNWADIELYNFAKDHFTNYISSMGESFQKKLENFKFLNSKYQKIANLIYKKTYQDSGSTLEIDLPKEIKW